MDNTHEALLNEYDACAGASFSLVGISDSLESHRRHELAGRQLLWLLINQCLALGHDAASSIQWLLDEYNRVRWCFGDCETKLVPALNDAWSTWLSIIAFAPEAYKEALWDLFSERFLLGHDDAPGLIAIRQLLRSVLSQGRTLYDPHTSQVPEKYSSPDQCIVVKLGLTVRMLRDQKPELGSVFESWRKALLESVLKKLPGRIRRGFAPEHPLFEDLVLCFIHVGQWLTQPESWRIPEYIKACAPDPSERFSADQAAFATALFGYIQGYRKVGDLVSAHNLRSLLSRQAMCIATRRSDHNSDGPADDRFLLLYATESGRAIDIAAPFVRIGRLARREEVVTEISVNAVGVREVKRSIKILAESVEVGLPGGIRPIILQSGDV